MSETQDAEALAPRPKESAARLESRRQWRLRHKEQAAAYRESWRARYPEKRRAHNMLFRAVQSGAVTKETACSVCGAGGRIVAHHDDYSKPFEVRWLCNSCHVRHHMEQGK